MRPTVAGLEVASCASVSRHLSQICYFWNGKRAKSRHLCPRDRLCQTACEPGWEMGSYDCYALRSRLRHRAPVMPNGASYA